MIYKGSGYVTLKVLDKGVPSKNGTATQCWVRRHRWWVNIGPTLGGCVVFAG